MFKKSLLALIVTSLIIIPGCSSPSGQPALQENSNMLGETTADENKASAIKTPESLGGVCLGDTIEKVTAVLGHDYIKTQIADQAGYIGEDMIDLSYDSGIIVTLGKESGEVIRVVSQSPGFETYLGAEVGNEAKSVLGKYKSTFKEVTSRHSNSTLPGWFNVGEEKVIIFDFDSEDGTRVNSDIMPDSVVQEIVLAYWKHFD